MSPNAQHFADRLRSALKFHSHEPRHREPEVHAQDLASQVSAPADTPGEEFARRLRQAIDA